MAQKAMASPAAGSQPRRSYCRPAAELGASRHPLVYSEPNSCTLRRFGVNGLCSNARLPTRKPCCDRAIRIARCVQHAQIGALFESRSPSARARHSERDLVCEQKLDLGLRALRSTRAQRLRSWGTLKRLDESVCLVSRIPIHVAPLAPRK